MDLSLSLESLTSHKKEQTPRKEKVRPMVTVSKVKEERKLLRLNLTPTEKESLENLSECFGLSVTKFLETVAIPEIMELDRNSICAGRYFQCCSNEGEEKKSTSYRISSKIYDSLKEKSNSLNINMKILIFYTVAERTEKIYQDTKTSKYRPRNFRLFKPT